MTCFPALEPSARDAARRGLAVLSTPPEFAICPPWTMTACLYGVPASLQGGEAIRCTSTPQTRAGTRRSILSRRSRVADSGDGRQAFFEDRAFRPARSGYNIRYCVREVVEATEFKHALVDLCMKYVAEAKRSIGKAMEK